MGESLHVMIEHDDAIKAKKDILLIEKDLLETIKCTRSYNSLRKQELVLKEKIRKNITILNTLIHGIEYNLPKDTVNYHEEQGKKTKEIVREVVKIQKKSSVHENKKSEIEQQIEDIREKLARLG